MERRSFLAGLLAAAAAPAIVRAGSLMPVRRPIWTPQAEIRLILQHSDDGVVWSDSSSVLAEGFPWSETRHWRVRAESPHEVTHSPIRWRPADPQAEWLRYDFGRAEGHQLQLEVATTPFAG